MTVLAVVPLTAHAQALEIIKKEANDLVTTINVDVSPIIKYFEKIWINGEFKPEEWNQFGIFNVRTNNNLEIFNNQINTQLRTKPSLVRFYEFTRDQENKMSLDVLRADLQPYYIPKQKKEVILIK